MPRPTIRVEFDADGIVAAINHGANRGLRSAATQVVNAMRERAPRDIGTLAESINHRGVSGSFLGGSLSVEIGVGVPYAPYLEYGTGKHGPKGRPYPIVPKHLTRKGKPGWLRWDAPPGAGSGGYIYARKVMHPGIRPQPFFFNTIEENRDLIADMIAQAIDSELSKLEG